MRKQAIFCVEVNELFGISKNNQDEVQRLLNILKKIYYFSQHFSEINFSCTDLGF